jgi:hypothetical protein
MNLIFSELLNLITIKIGAKYLAINQIIRFINCIGYRLQHSISLPDDL